MNTGHETGLTGIENGMKTGLKRDLFELEMVKRFFQVLERPRKENQLQNGKAITDDKIGHETGLKMGLKWLSGMYRF